MFPEGLSRYYPELSPLKQGVARIVSDVLGRQTSNNNPDFKLAIQTCSITYLHRNLFRSSVLVTFHPPLIVTPKTHPTLIASSPSFSYDSVRLLTNQMGEQIRSGILDAPSWEFIRVANTARRLYAPLGTRLGLGDHVRLTQRFVDVLANKKRATTGWEEGLDAKVLLKKPMILRTNTGISTTTTSTLGFGGETSGVQVVEKKVPTSEEEIEKLVQDLKVSIINLLFRKL